MSTNEPEQTEEAQPQEAKSQSAPERRKLLTAGNIAIALLVTTSVLWLPPIFFGALGVLDSVRDFTRGYEGAKVESLREYLDGNDIWTDDPRILGSSLRFLENHTDAKLVSLADFSLEPVAKTTSQLNEEAVDLAGDPIVLVGRVLEYRQRTSDPLDYSYAEVRLAAASGGYVWCGLGGSAHSQDTHAERGEVLVLRGVVTAIGPVGRGATRRQVAYFTALETVESFLAGGLPPNVRSLVKQIRNGQAPEPQ